MAEYIPARIIRSDVDPHNSLVEDLQLLDKSTGQQIGLEPLEADFLSVLPVHAQCHKSNGCNCDPQEERLL